MRQKDDKTGSGPEKGRGDDGKARRLGEALRENLRRRKAQARARTGEAAADGKPLPSVKDKT